MGRYDGARPASAASPAAGSTPHPLATMAEAIQVQGSHLKVMKKTFALASAWEPNPFRQFYEHLQGDPAWITCTIESGHDAMLDKPEEVPSLLSAKPTRPNAKRVKDERQSLRRICGSLLRSL